MKHRSAAQDRSLFGFVQLNVGFVRGVVQNIERVRHGKQPRSKQAGAQCVVQIAPADLQIAFELHGIEGVRVQPVRLAVVHGGACVVVGGDERESPGERQPLEMSTIRAVLVPDVAHQADRRCKLTQIAQVP